MHQPRLHREFLVHLKAGNEAVASKHFFALDEASEWGVKTTEKIRRALDADIFQQLATNLLLDIECVIFSDSYRSVSKVWRGSLGEVDNFLAPAIRKFEATLLPEEMKKAEAALRKNDGKRVRRAFAFAGVAAFGIVLIYSALRAIPPIFDTEVLSARLLSVPPDFLAGSWGSSTRPDDCERARMTFARGRLEMQLPTGFVSYAASYEVLGPNTVKVAVVAGTSRFTKQMRVEPSQSALTIQRIDLPEGASKAQVAVAAGSRFFKCG